MYISTIKLLREKEAFEVLHIFTYFVIFFVCFFFYISDCYNFLSVNDGNKFLCI